MLIEASFVRLNKNDFQTLEQVAIETGFNETDEKAENDIQNDFNHKHENLHVTLVPPERPFARNENHEK